MQFKSIIASVEKHITLSGAEKKYFSSLLLPIRLKQNEFVEEAGEVSTGTIYVSSGCLMTYYSDESGNDHVIQFSMAGWWTGDIHSITTKEPSIYSTRALTESELLLLPQEKIEELFLKVPAFERYFRIIYQNSLVTHQHRLIQNNSLPAETRYHNFLRKYPTLEQFVPLKYIASYLGITPEFLSKIRRKQMEK